MNDELFAGVRPVRPSPELRARVLAVAHSVSPRRAWWQELGLGRWDLAWVGAAVVLVMANLALPRPGRVATPKVSLEEQRELVALARDLGVPVSMLDLTPAPGRVGRGEDMLRLVLDEKI